MVEQLIHRAEALLTHRRYSEAEELLATALEQSPNNVLVLHLYSRSLTERNEHEKALTLIDQAIHLSPDYSYLHFAKASILINLEDYDKAEEFIATAINLDPSIAQYYAYWATIKVNRKDYKGGLNLADQALMLEPENILALNTRSTALLKLNQKEDAAKTIEGALKEDPDNPYTHANYGWGLLERGEPKKALKHFQEALTLDPDFQYAQVGMGEALKARYWLYKAFLKYSFWISNFTAKYQWFVIIGFYFAIQGLDAAAKSNEILATFLTPLVILLSLVAFSTWVIRPISNLFLRFNSFGKHLLSAKEKLSSNIVAISFGVFALSLVSYFIVGAEKWLALAAFGFIMMVPSSVLFDESKYKYGLIIYTLLMMLVGVMSLFITFQTGQLFNGLSTLFIFGFIGFQFIYNFLTIRSSNL